MTIDVNKAFEEYTRACHHVEHMIEKARTAHTELRIAVDEWADAFDLARHAYDELHVREGREARPDPPDMSQETYAHIWGRTVSIYAEMEEEWRNAEHREHVAGECNLLTCSWCKGEVNS